jgi:D-arabinan exo alpha-(1,3)/(1,5)-arabinofuranosidase (non-reducing end)
MGSPHRSPVGLAILIIVVMLASARAETAPSTVPPPIPFDVDAITQWERWPYLRIGVRCYMRSTFDRTGGNNNADAAHFIRQIDDTHNVALDEAGPGILWFARYNHWHGSPWQYLVEGKETIVRETSTADPLHPAKDSVFEPRDRFPAGLNYTWSATKGADFSWTPIPFEKDLRIAYGRAHYGTGYFILWKVLPGYERLSRPLASWNSSPSVPKEAIDLIGRAGTDICPKRDRMREEDRKLQLPSSGRTDVWSTNGEPRTIRRMAFRVPERFAEIFAHARLRVYWDGARPPSVDAPVGLFFGAGSLLRDPDQEYIVKSFPMTIRFDAKEKAFEFVTYFPMPFQKSARVELTNTVGGPVDDIRFQIRHEPFTDPPNWVGNFHATYKQHSYPELGADLELLDTRKVEDGGEWCGHIVGTTYTFTKRGDLTTLEGDPRFFLDDSLTPQGQGTGSEEWGGGGDYWGGRRMTLPFAGHPVGRPPGQMKVPIDKIHSAYRFLLSDLIPFGRNARFTLEHGGTNESNEDYETVTYWYGLHRPAIVQTDELDVGDLDSELAHNYQSPDATRPEKLESRHEIGVDKLPRPGSNTPWPIFPTLSDFGRRTKTHSEFTLKIRPDAAGVMLRRRLDLAYPNQKAIVYVADADAAEPEWKEAGVWYTAGGNTVVFGDPRVVPEKQRTQHVELMPPVHVVQTSNRRWRDDEFLLPPALTRGRNKIRVRCKFVPVGEPLFPGHPPQEEAWTEFHYWAYCFVMPAID